MADKQVNINGNLYPVPEGDEDMPLLWFIRDSVGMVGTKFGCGMAQCGACTVHLNGSPIRSCSFPVGAVGTGKITTIEGLASEDSLHALQEAWIEKDVPQCGYCQAGQIMSAAALLATNAMPNDKDIDQAMSGNLCRCASYIRIREAIHVAADKLNTSVKEA